MTATEIAGAPLDLLVAGEIAAPRSSSLLQARIETGADALLALEAAWRGLETRARHATFFQSFAWCRYIATALESTDGFEPIVVSAWQRDQLVAVWPLRLSRHSGARVLVALGAPYDQSSEILIDRMTNAPTVIAAMIELVRRDIKADGLLLRKARRSGDVIEIARRGACIIDEGARAPQVTFDPAQPFTTFLSTVSSKTRKNIRNYENRLARLGRLEHRVLEGTDAAKAIAYSFELRSRSLDTKGLSSTAFRDPHFESLIRNLGGAQAEDLDLIVFALQLDGRSIAVQWGFVQAGRYYAYMSARESEFEAYSVGRIHLKHVLEECHARGIGHADLMVPAVPYKTTWTDRADEMVDLVWPWTASGMLVLTLYEQMLRPRLKALASMLPAALRRRLLGAGHSLGQPRPLSRGRPNFLGQRGLSGRGPSGP